MKIVTEYRRPAIEQMTRSHLRRYPLGPVEPDGTVLMGTADNSLRNFSAAAGGDDDDADEVLAGASQASDGYVGVAFASGKGDYRQFTLTTGSPPEE